MVDVRSHGVKGVGTSMILGVGMTSSRHAKTGSNNTSGHM